MTCPDCRFDAYDLAPHSHECPRFRPIDACPHCHGRGGRAEEECPTHGVAASLAAINATEANRQAREAGKPAPYPTRELSGLAAMHGGIAALPSISREYGEDTK